MDHLQKLLVKDEVETVTVEDAEEGHEGQIMPQEVDKGIHHIIEANEDLVDELCLVDGEPLLC